MHEKYIFVNFFGFFKHFKFKNNKSKHRSLLKNIAFIKIICTNNKANHVHIILKIMSYFSVHLKHFLIICLIISHIRTNHLHSRVNSTKCIRRLKFHVFAELPTACGKSKVLRCYANMCKCAERSTEII